MCYFLNKEPCLALVTTKICTNCGAEHFISYGLSRCKFKKYFYNGSTENQFISFTKETIFEINLLSNYTSHLLFCHATFMGYCNAFNWYHKSKESYISKESRKILNPKRLAEGWMYLQILLLEIERCGSLTNFNGIDVCEINDYLSNIRRTLLPYFIEKWSSFSHKNACINKKCSIALNIDGLHKINRLKCIYKKDYNIPEIGILNIKFI